MLAHEPSGCAAAGRPTASSASRVLVVGLVEVWSPTPATGPDSAARHALARWCVGIAVAVGSAAGRPALALGLVWVTLRAAAARPASPVLTVEVAVAIVAFGCARWGRPATVVAERAVDPGAPARRLRRGRADSTGVYRDARRVVPASSMDSAYRFSDTWLVGAAILGAGCVLAVPWLAGLVLRLTARAAPREVAAERAEADAARAQRETEQAREIARLREEQARLARDVHDVVGHSLAVILAQAESAQYLADDDPEAEADDGHHRRPRPRPRCRTCARCSSRPSTPARRRTGGARRAWSTASAPAATRSSSTEVGTPQPLPPELEVGRLPGAAGDAHQRHQARPPRPAGHVERHWPEGSLGPRPAHRGPQRRSAPTRTADETQPLRADRPAGPGARRDAAPARGGRRPARRTPPRRGPAARPSPRRRGCR